MIQKYYNPLNEEKIKQRYERTKRTDKHKEYRENHKEEAKEYHKGNRSLEKSKKEYYERDKFNILAKTKQQLRECEIRNCQNKGGESFLTRHNKTRKNISNVKKKDEQ